MGYYSKTRENVSLVEARYIRVTYYQEIKVLRMYQNFMKQMSRRYNNKYVLFALGP